MAITKFLKEIGRGKEGARALSRGEASLMFGEILDGTVTDLEVGAFCLAMRIKGETPQEMAGFLDATHARLQRIPVPPGAPPTVVIPSYNGARKLPVLTPLLALLLAREGLAVVVHGAATEATRVFVGDVFVLMGVQPQTFVGSLAPGSCYFFPTALLNRGLQRLLEVRKIVGLRNSAHSLVKLMNPLDGPMLLVTSYTHPEYATAMAQTIGLMHTTALLLRGTEGEAVADPRRSPKMQTFVKGLAEDMVEHQTGPLLALPDVPTTTDPQSTANYIQSVLDGHLPIPLPLQQQVRRIVQLAHADAL